MVGVDRKAAAIASTVLAACLIPTLLYAQASFSVGGHEVQIHGFLSEAFACTSDNNYLRMETRGGSFFTEAGLNVSAPLTEKLRVGAQVYDRYIGELGKGRVYLDWAFADYRLKDWLGFRAGKIKTSLGLYTDTQDQEFLHTWALLPQSVYPVDLRSVNVAHAGGDIYGHVDTTRGGSFSYTAFAGSVSDDPRGGYRYGIEALGGHLTSGVTGRTAGIDVRWDAPVPGLSMGTSLAFNHGSFKGTLGASPVPLSFSTTDDRVKTVFAEYARGGFRAESEYRTHTRRAELTAEIPGRPIVRTPGADETAWFVAGAYRFSKWVEAGSYYSRYSVNLINPVVALTGPGRDHQYDKVVTLRIDATRFWDFKIEGHFIDGVGSPAQAHGFYPQDNPAGLQPSTNMLVVRTGWYF